MRATKLYAHPRLHTCKFFLCWGILWSITASIALRDLTECPLNSRAWTLLTAPVPYCTPLMNIVINPSVTLLHLDDVVILVEGITFFFCNIISWSRNKGFAVQQVFIVFGNGVWLILEVLTRFPLIESVHGLFVWNCIAVSQLCRCWFSIQMGALWFRWARYGACNLMLFTCVGGGVGGQVWDLVHIYAGQRQNEERFLLVGRLKQEYLLLPVAHCQNTQASVILFCDMNGEDNSSD